MVRRIFLSCGLAASAVGPAAESGAVIKSEIAEWQQVITLASVKID